MYSIGQLSRISGMTAKALRLYHERGILVPTVVNPTTGYRYYDEGALERARAIAALRSMLVSLEDIQTLLAETAPDSDTIAILERHRDRIDARRRELSGARKAITAWIEKEKRNNAVAIAPGEIGDAELPLVLVVALRFRGKYGDVGGAFGRLGRAARSAINGPALALFYDDEFMDEGANIECCMPVSREIRAPGIVCRELPGGPALTVRHHGPYETIGRSYARAFSEINTRHGSVVLPTREVYVKGPGLILKGNPASYITDLQFMIQ